MAMVSAVKATKRIAVALYEQARWKEIVEAQVRAETGAEGVHGRLKLTSYRSIISKISYGVP